MKNRHGTQLSDYDYELPESFIAQFPTEPRDHCKMMVIHRKSNLEHRKFYELPEYLRSGDVLVLNETRVFPARLIGNKATGGKIEVFLLEPQPNDTWKALVRPGRRFRRGSVAFFGEKKLKVEVVDELPDGIRKIKTIPGGDAFFQIISEIGHVPLPPYIRREDTPKDRTDYQTVYARETGSVAAPTAGLHFTPALLQKIKKLGVSIVPVTLHIGLDTFRPVSVENISAHQMHTEFYNISNASAEKINETRRHGGRILAVGTTSVRTLETASTGAGEVRAGSGWSELFIYPGYKWSVVDGIITNFHLPKSSLMMMISAFTSLPVLKHAYETAKTRGYRFFSYGDAMLLL